MRFQKVEQDLAHVPKGSQVFPFDDDQFRAQLPSIGDEHELLDALCASIIVARCKDILLLYAKRLGLEMRVLVFIDLRVEAVIVLSPRRLVVTV